MAEDEAAGYSWWNDPEHPETLHRGGPPEPMRGKPRGADASRPAHEGKQTTLTPRYVNAVQICLPIIRDCRTYLAIDDAPVHTVVEAKALISQAKKLGLTPGELAAVYDVYASTRDYGKVVSKTGGLRKGQVAKEATGKSGGYRVFSFFADLDNPVFLLWMLDKTDEYTLTDKQKVFNALISVLKKELRR